MKFLSKIFLSFLTVVFIQSHALAQKPTNNHDKLAIQYFELKDYEKANEYFDDLFDKNPDAW